MGRGKHVEGAKGKGQEFKIISRCKKKQRGNLRVNGVERVTVGNRKEKRRSRVIVYFNDMIVRYRKVSRK